MRVTLGRGSENDWQLDDPDRHVSTRHCIVGCDGGRYTITDVNSTNGVYLNGERIAPNVPTPLVDGNRLMLADIYELSVQIDAGESARPEPARVNSRELAGNPFAHPERTASRLIVDDDNPFPNPRGTGQPARSPFEDDPPTLPELGEDRRFEPIGPGASRLPAGWLSGNASDEPLQPPQRGAVSDHGAPERTSYRPPSGGLPADFNEILPSPAVPEMPAPMRREPAAMPAPIADDGLMAAFLEGAGINPDALGAHNQAELMRVIGRLFRLMTAGAQESLQSRQILKSEFRIAQTQIQATENNPLKFAVGIEQAMVALLTQREGYLQGLKAVQEAFRDIREHELATLASMQAAARSLLAEFHPDRLKQRLDKQPSLMDLLPASRKARYWDIYEQEYEKIATSALEDARGMFGRSFADAYEDYAKPR